jgi:small GTP-binding protein
MSENKNDSFPNIKVILLGETAVGTTNLINAYCDREFVADASPTNSPEFSQRKIKIDSKKYLIDLWDTAGQERYHSMTKIFIKGAQIIIFAYDITNEDSFKKLNFWVNFAEELLWEETVYGVVGNKTDLYDNQKVNINDAQKFADEIGALLCETSAKVDQMGFKKYVEKLVRKLIEKNNIINGIGEKLSKKKIEKKGCKC